ncbi:MAG TPA: hypothetical protein VL551_16010 [Actinospica sp.]|jgi:hypothetical protein|nr:hypothetical protein [Actinospica sp.]
MPRFADSASAVRVRVRVVRFASLSFVGSMPAGPTADTCSQLVNPASVEPALTCGSCMSASADGARVSGAQPVFVGTGAAEVGRACGENVDLYIDCVAVAPPFECFDVAVLFAVVTGAVVCPACEVVCSAVVLTGIEKIGGRVM